MNSIQPSQPRVPSPNGRLRIMPSPHLSPSSPDPSLGDASRSMSKPMRKHWVDPHALPNAGPDTLRFHRAREIKGNAPIHAKQLALNVFATYGVGPEGMFGQGAGREVRWVQVDADYEHESRGEEAEERKARRVEAVAEVVVNSSMVNGNGMMHGGCIAYLIDNCGSVPLVVLGVLRESNGVGVTQALNILFHAPAPLGATLVIKSTSLALGGRSMTSKCEMYNKSNMRLVASAFLNKMEPKL